EPGSTNLLGPSMEKLDAVAGGLVDRPEVRLEIQGGLDFKTAAQNAKTGERAPDYVQRRSSKFDGEKGGAALMRMFPSAAAKDWDEEGGLQALIDWIPGDPQSLAAARARNVRLYLIQSGKVQGDRISIIRAAPDSSEDRGKVYL